jgi:polysaccharide biosynthesis protein PslF
VSTTVHRPATGADLPPVPAPRSPGKASRPAAVGILSTYPPTQCGLATFSAALTEQLNRRAGTAGVVRVVVRVVDRAESHPGAEVAAHVVNGSPSSAVAAVRHLNGFDAVVVQHEYGIYGGADGCDVIDIVAGLTVPTIIVLHTVLQEPTPRQRRILRWLV